MDLADIMVRGSAVVRENDAADHLRRCAESLVYAVAGYEGFGVVPASPQAERVLGAAMMLAPALHATRSGPAIVFDVNFASGTLLARAAQRLREDGNDSRLVGLVLNSLVETGTEIHVAQLDRVDLVPKRATLRQHGQGCVGRVAVPALS